MLCRGGCPHPPAGPARNDDPKAFPWGKVPPKGADEGNAEDLEAVASERIKPSPSQGADSPYQGEMSRRDKRDREGGPKGPDEGGYRWVRRPSNGRMGTSAPTQGYNRFRRGRCPQRPADNGCTPVVPLIRHGLRPCHLLPCGAKALACIFRDAQMSMAFPSSVTAYAVPPSPRGRLF